MLQHQRWLKGKHDGVACNHEYCEEAELKNSFLFVYLFFLFCFVCFFILFQKNVKKPNTEIFLILMPNRHTIGFITED